MTTLEFTQFSSPEKESTEQEPDSEKTLSSDAKIDKNYMVLHRNENFIISLNRFNELCWELKNIPMHANSALNEFILINGLIAAFFNRSNKKYVSKLLASRLYYCLTTQDTYDTELIFKEVWDIVNKYKGVTNKRVIETSEFAVYLSGANNVEWWYYKEVPAYMVGALDEFELLKELASGYLPPSYKPIIMSQLASALGNAFNKNDHDRAKDCFKQTKQFLISKIESFLKLRLFITSVLFSLVFLTVVIALYFCFPSFGIYVIGMGAGVVGAMVSSLQRNNIIAIENYTSGYSLYCESLSRLIIGAVFGCFLVFGVKSEMFLAPFKENFQAIICFCFVSGFVERFVPELINSVVRESEVKGGR
ncbi:hypothetical protein [Citrobacter sp. MNAZ 1397]|uniref:Uncharacterized protein n=1 Tax=Citrobacter bitternis TaxID=1585982 RepID=A0ABW1PUT6_9ENTR|nr:hypothetical protein [Citrobacter sp. MNAZ 1397]MCL9672671.1 hypothetical protein [Citrobacter sp. MNAZ 1397]